MKTCSYCGKENVDTAVYCVGCGLEVASSQEAAAAGEDPADRLAVLATFSDPVEASILQGRLEQAGIEACIPEELSATAFSNLPLGQVTVRVAERDFAAAKAIRARGLRSNP